VTTLYLAKHELPEQLYQPSASGLSPSRYHPPDEYTGSDYEAAENNLNDDIMSVIEYTLYLGVV
jgi:hypothetical protein